VKKKQKGKREVMSDTKMHNTIDEMIAKSGRCIIATNDGDWEFAYTIGNQAKQLPELLVIGPPDREAHALLNALSNTMLANGKGFENGEQILVRPEGPAVEVWDCGDKARNEYTVQAGVHYKSESYRIQQVVIADPLGQYPDSERCMQPWGAIPLMYREITPKKTLH
jgi:Domain of unknown function (DUF4262)